MNDITPMAFTSDEPPTLAEIYRTLLRIEQLALPRIEAQTSATNGRLLVVEREAVRVDQRLLQLERAHESCQLVRPEGTRSRAADAPADRREEPLDARRIAIGIAMIGSATWAAIELIMRLGDWLQSVGIRK